VTDTLKHSEHNKTLHNIKIQHWYSLHMLKNNFYKKCNCNKQSYCVWRSDRWLE